MAHSNEIPDDMLTRMAARLRSLGDPARLAILRQLVSAEEMNVGQVVGQTGHSWANVSTDGCASFTRWQYVEMAPAGVAFRFVVYRYPLAVVLPVLAVIPVVPVVVFLRQWLGVEMFPGT